MHDKFPKKELCRIVDNIARKRASVTVSRLIKSGQEVDYIEIKYKDNFLRKIYLKKRKYLSEGSIKYFNNRKDYSYY
ncbi:hypothetical protein GF336_01175 [Candidatus Woesearchaeota archaeon]|nr:hypothetical protein [Candidatus Woesearchaeota archaeon]